MPKRRISLDLWMEALREASTELAASSLRFDATPVPRSEQDPDAQPGAYIALLGENVSMHLGLTSSPEGCRMIARGLLGITRASELTDREVMDGVSEVVNIIAGKVKSAMVSHDPTLRLGLPMFIVGQVRLTEQMERTVGEVRLGPVDCQLHVYRNARAA